jgi:hypothetical protein
MLVSFVLARVRACRLGTRTILPLALAACSDGDLFIPDDRAPVQLRAVSGNGQSAVAGSPVPHPLVAEALDRAGRPVEGAVIVFQFVGQPDGAAIAPSASETDPDGLASVEVTLGRPVGDQPVDARLDDPERDVRVRFLLTAIRSNSGGGDDDDDSPPDDGGSSPPDDGDGDDDEGKGKGNGKGGKDGHDNSGPGNGDD